MHSRHLFSNKNSPQPNKSGSLANSGKWLPRNKLDKAVFPPELLAAFAPSPKKKAE